MKRIIRIRLLGDYRLELTFDDGVFGTADLGGLAGKGIFVLWSEPGAFGRVRIGSSGELAWDDAIDLCPDSLYLRVTGKKQRIFSLRCRISRSMPEISRFLGIVIKMFFDDHNPPHFHAEYGERAALIDILNLSLFSGSLPPRVLGLVIEWAILHRQELLDDWERARAQQELQKIAPLE
jgi:hypothetical protein